MATFINECTKRCKEASAPFGFACANKVFWRIIGDMYQSFYIEVYSPFPKVKKCRVGFCVLPLCLGLDAEKDICQQGAYYLKRFEAASSHSEEFDGWLYTSDEASQQKCCDEVSRMLLVYLMPFFERSSSSETALSEVIQLEALFHDNRLAELGLLSRPEMDPAGPNARLNMYDSIKCYLAIKSGDYEFALKIISAVLQQNIRAYENVKNVVSKDNLLLREEKIEEQRFFAERIREKNFEYFETIFKANEVKSRESFATFIDKAKRK